MLTSLLKQSDARAGLSDVDRVSGEISATLVGRYTLSGLGRTQRTQIDVPGGRLIIERENEEPAWLIPTVQAMGELLGLPENWDSYGARPVNPGVVSFALQLLSETMRADTSAPAVVPTSCGGVQLEWHTRGIDLEIEIRSPGRMYVSYADQQQDTEWEGELTSDLTRLSHFISELSHRH